MLPSAHEAKLKWAMLEKQAAAEKQFPPRKSNAEAAEEMKSKVL